MSPAAPMFKHPKSGQNDFALKMAVNNELDVFQMYYLVDSALKEDVGLGDITSRALFGEDEMTGGSVPGPDVSARFFAKSAGLLCGTALLAMTIKLANETLTFDLKMRDGERLKPGDEIAVVRGPAAPILAAERTGLNFLGLLSGIATHARKFVDAVEGTGVDIMDTRKTTPGWRLFEKYATRTGGAKNHRLGLYHQAMLKENHLRASGLSIPAAIAKLRERHPNLPEQNRGSSFITAEVETLAEFESCLDIGADVLMLDDFSMDDIKKAVELRNARNAAKPDARPLLLEVSGGVSLSNVRAIAETGVDRVSIGAITHSAPAMDFSLLVDHNH